MSTSNPVVSNVQQAKRLEKVDNQLEAFREHKCESLVLFSEMVELYLLEKQVEFTEENKSVFINTTDSIRQIILKA